MNKLIIKLLIEQKGMVIEDFNTILSNNGFDELIWDNEELSEAFRNLQVEYFNNNFQYINKTSLLLNAASRVIIGIKLLKGEEVKGLELNPTLDTNEYNIEIENSINFLRDIRKELKRNGYDDRKYSMYIDDENVITVSKSHIDKFLSRCTKNDYVTDKEIEEIHKEILEGNLIGDVEKRKIANVNLEDLIRASKSYEEKESDTPKKNKILQCSIELAEYLVSSGEITNKELLNSYLQGNFNYKLIAGIDMPEFTEEYYANEFTDLYYQTVFAQQIEETKKVLQRFSILYSYLEKIEKVTINRDNLIGEMIVFFGEEFAPEILSDLHELNIITIEKGIEWVGADIFVEKYKRGNLKPQEVRNFYEENKEKHLNDIARIINKLPDNGEKFMVIGSIFPEETEEDKETRELLFDECLKIDNGIKNSNSGNKRKSGQNKSNDYYKHITDPFARISLIKALDKDYSFEMTEDGHAIVKLPSFGKVIIEKMLDKNREPSYGAATYILDQKYYEDNKFRIIKDGKIARQEILKDVESKTVTRIIHSIKRWGIDIKEYFLQTEKIEWTNDQEKTINEAIGRVKRSDPIIRDRQQLAKMILNLIVTRKATLEQIEKIAEIYDVDLEKVMDSLDER